MNLNNNEDSSLPGKAQKHRARKRFGQNFLHDDFVIQKIVAAIHPQAEDNMVEIGPGKGALTAALLPELNALQAIELDRDLIPVLKTRFATTQHLTIHQADALNFDYAQLIDNAQQQKLRIVGNLPYNISTPLIFHLLQYKEIIQDMHFMLQLELVQRLSAQPGNKTYGRLSVFTQYFCQVQKIFDVAPGAFIPAPKVKSAIVKLTPLAKPLDKIKDINLFEQVLRCAFSMRRKTLRNNLKSLLDNSQLEKLEFDLKRRSEQLSVPEFVALSNQIYQLTRANRQPAL